MSDQKTNKRPYDFDIAARIQEKVQFYSVTLVFTLLALSVQTAKFNAGILSNVFELSGWTCFIISGIIGLHRLNRVVSVYQMSAVEEAWRTNLKKGHAKKMEGAKEISIEKDGEVITVDTIKYIEDFKNKIKELSQKRDELETTQLKKYRFHFNTLFVGLSFIILSRGYKPLSELFKLIGNFLGCS